MEASKKKFELIFKNFNRKEYIKTDPICFVHSYTGNENQEVVALISALFSYGNVKSIQKTLKKILKPLGKNPHNKLKNLSDKNIQQLYSEFYYRFYRSSDIIFLMKSLRDLLRTYGTLGNAFKKHWNGDLLTSSFEFRKTILKNTKLSYGIKFMWADPLAGTAKRWHMFLRWMVRKDEIDLGLWDFIPKKDLIQPLDTHLFAISRKLGLTKRKTPSLAAALEVSEKFRRWSPDDPIKYDFALCRMGILKLKHKMS